MEATGGAAAQDASIKAEQMLNSIVQSVQLGARKPTPPSAAAAADAAAAAAAAAGAESTGSKGSWTKEEDEVRACARAGLGP